MAYIKTDHKQLEKSAKNVDNYISQMKSKMKTAQNEVEELCAVWTGIDYTQFKGQWNKVVTSDSVYYKMLKSLESYSKYLKYAAAQYKDAQIKAINRANALPK